MTRTIRCRRKMKRNYSAYLMLVPILFKASFELRSRYPWSPKLALDTQDWLYD
jgi:hypothetical protein